MKVLTLNIGLLGLIAVLGCSDQTSPAAAASDLAVADGAACYSVKFTTDLTPVTDVDITGTVTGDLQGTVDMSFDEFSSFRGVTNRVAADAVWHITGGIIPELVGETFVTRLTNRNVLLPGTSLVKNIGSLRVISGVEKANVTYTGQTALDTDPQETILNFVGVICPS
jgi:hypothetical protein